MLCKIVLLCVFMRISERVTIMLEQVEKKIEELKKVQAREYYKKKDADLDAWGLTSRKEGNKNILIIVTNEEYEALIKASNGVGDTSRNKTSRLLNWISLVVLILGAIAGGVVLAVSESMGFVYFSLAVVVAGVLAALLKGVSEAINLLQQIIDTKPVETPEYSEEELDLEEAANKKSGKEKGIIPPQYPMPYPQYAEPQYADPQQPVQAVQPPIYHAAPQQPMAVQAYQTQPYTLSPQVPVAPASLQADLEEVYGSVNANPSEPLGL